MKETTNTSREIKLLVGALLLFVMSFIANAQFWQSTNVIAAPMSNSIFSGRVSIGAITVMPTVPTNVTVTFYDTAYGSNKYTGAAYTNVVYYKYTNNVIWTNDNLIVITNSYPGLSSYYTNVAAGIRSYPPMYSISVASGGSLTVPVNLNFSRGLSYYVSTNCIINLEYSLGSTIPGP